MREKKVKKKERKVSGWMDGWTGRSSNSEPQLHKFPPKYRGIFIKVRLGYLNRHVVTERVEI